MNDEIIDELLDAFEEVSDDTLHLWSNHKTIGGPIVTVGLSTPSLCEAIIRWRKDKGSRL